MQIKKNEINKIFTIFLLAHLTIWTLLPTLLNTNLPLDTIEAIAWGYGWPLGWEKHPPLSSWFPELFYQIFGNQDWAFYFLSQIFVILSFIIIFNFSKIFFKNHIYSLLSVLLLEGIFFYNYTTPEFNVNVCPLPFYTLTVYYFWKGINQKDNLSWLLFGFFAGLGVLSKYLFIYLLISLDLFIIYLIYIRKFQFRCLISLVSFVLVLLPHLIWLIDNDYTTISYALERTSAENVSFLESHLLFPFTFFAKQIGILIPFFILFFIMISKFKIKIKHKDIKLIFLFFVTVSPVLLTFLTSLVLLQTLLI